MRPQISRILIWAEAKACAVGRSRSTLLQTTSGRRLLMPSFLAYLFSLYEAIAAHTVGNLGTWDDRSLTE